MARAAPPPTGLLSAWLGDLDVPSHARLVAVETSIDEATGSQTWTVTFRAALPDASAPQTRTEAEAPPASLPSEVGAHAPPVDTRLTYGLPPPPPPLSAQQLAGGMAAPVLAGLPLIPPADVSTRSRESSPGSPRSPYTPEAPAPPAAFPVLPTQAGAINRLFPLRCVVMTYAWGRRGDTSLVGRLAASNGAPSGLQPAPLARLKAEWRTHSAPHCARQRLHPREPHAVRRAVDGHSPERCVPHLHPHPHPHPHPQARPHPRSCPHPHPHPHGEWVGTHPRGASRGFSS
jgi:hypothetical protein